MADEKNVGSMKSLMVENRKFPPSQEVVTKAYIKSMGQYQQMWDESIKQPDKFWLKQAETLAWYKKPTKSL
ncbi:MAG: acetyl-coenzyme A synthetase N-terminal domain-containing protein, partial [Chitinivibrionales bacterium]|nr:acetyl-coenzyme A synthetase N-terminal domain-containing protein [Chitinivibrionales bacterium]